MLIRTGSEDNSKHFESWQQMWKKEISLQWEFWKIALFGHLKTFVENQPKQIPWNDNLSSQLCSTFELVKCFPQTDQRRPLQQGPTLRHFAIFIVKNKANGVEVGKWNLNSPRVMSHEALKKSNTSQD